PGDVLDQTDAEALLEVERDVDVRLDRRSVLVSIALVDGECVAVARVELDLLLEGLVVGMRHVGVVHPGELAAAVAEHALKRGVRLGHDPAAPDRDPDGSALENEADTALGLLRRQSQALELAHEAPAAQ